MLGYFLLVGYTQQSRSFYFSMSKHLTIYSISNKCSVHNFVSKICRKPPNSMKLKLWDKSFFNTIMINMIVIPIWQVCTRNTPKLLSHLPVYIWRCLNVRIPFLYPRMFKKYSTSEPNKGLDN